MEKLVWAYKHKLLREPQSFPPANGAALRGGAEEARLFTAIHTYNLSLTPQGVQLLPMIVIQFGLSNDRLSWRILSMF